MSQSIQISNCNFAIALNLLDERYSNKREQTFAYIKLFLCLPSIETKSAIHVLNLADNINEISVSLQILNKIDKLGETLMTYLISQKLVPFTNFGGNVSLRTMKFCILRI